MAVGIDGWSDAAASRQVNGKANRAESPRSARFRAKVAMAAVEGWASAGGNGATPVPPPPPPGPPGAPARRPPGAGTGRNPSPGNFVVAARSIASTANPRPNCTPRRLPAETGRLPAEPAHTAASSSKPRAPAEPRKNSPFGRASSKEASEAASNVPAATAQCYGRAASPREPASGERPPSARRPSSRLKDVPMASPRLPLIPQIDSRAVATPQKPHHQPPARESPSSKVVADPKAICASAESVGGAVHALDAANASTRSGTDVSIGDVGEEGQECDQPTGPLVPKRPSAQAPAHRRRFIQSTQASEAVEELDSAATTKSNDAALSETSPVAAAAQLGSALCSPVKPKRTAAEVAAEPLELTVPMKWHRLSTLAVLSLFPVRFHGQACGAFEAEIDGEQTHGMLMQKLSESATFLPDVDVDVDADDEEEKVCAEPLARAQGSNKEMSGQVGNGCAEEKEQDDDPPRTPIPPKYRHGSLWLGGMMNESTTWFDVGSDSEAEESDDEEKAKHAEEDEEAPQGSDSPLPLGMAGIRQQQAAPGIIEGLPKCLSYGP